MSDIKFFKIADVCDESLYDDSVKTPNFNPINQMTDKLSDTLAAEIKAFPEVLEDTDQLYT
jgi:hypothetical protein